MHALTDRRLVLRGSLAGATALAALGLAACTDNPSRSTPVSDGGSGEQAAGGPIAVTLTDDDCELSATTFPAGVITFEITNEGTVPNEFEVLAEDQLRIISEQENLGPGTSVSLTVSLEEGTCYAACKPNMVGDLVGVTELTVTEGAAEAVDADTADLEEQAVVAYTAYVRDQVGQLVTATQEFTEAYLAGDTELAQALFPQARRYYERIEPTAEAFGIQEPGDLDVALDIRIQDLAADAGTEVTAPEVLAGWTGWHRIEADLFSDDEAFAFPDDAARQDVADGLNETTQQLYDFVYGTVDGAGEPFELTLQDVVNGASSLMNEVASSKIVGEEDTFSHTDLDDFQANLDGARVAYGTVQTLTENADADLAATIDERFAAVQAELDQHVDGTSPDGEPAYVDYSTIAAVQEDAGEAPGEDAYTEAQRALSRTINALAESLSQVAGAIL